MLDLEQRLDRAPRPSLQRLGSAIFSSFPDISLLSHQRCNHSLAQRQRPGKRDHPTNDSSAESATQVRVSRFQRGGVCGGHANPGRRFALPWADEFWRLWRETR